MISLSQLQESSLLHNLRLRYFQEKIYVREKKPTFFDLSSFTSFFSFLFFSFLSFFLSFFFFWQTYTGNILVAVNPYKDIPGLYDMNAVRQYKDVPIGELPPHIFAIGNATYFSLQRAKKNQCVVIRLASPPFPPKISRHPCQPSTST